jgi:hypothetical protein
MLSQMLDANVMKICDENLVKFQLLKRVIGVKQYTTRNVAL